MGQHTWFYKDSSLINRENEDSDYESDDFDFLDDNDAGYHDIFRTDERNEDGQAATFMQTKLEKVVSITAPKHRIHSLPERLLPNKTRTVCSSNGK